ncbi:unnamed protein product, partial [Ectocarpus sp. 12 AP-2014]
DAVGILRGHPSFKGSINGGTISDLQKAGVTTLLPFGPGGGFPGIRAQGTTDARAQGTTDAPGSEEGSEDGDDVDEREQRAPVATEEPGLLAGVELDSFLHATENGPGKISSFCEVDG